MVQTRVLVDCNGEMRVFGIEMDYMLLVMNTNGILERQT